MISLAWAISLISVTIGSMTLSSRPPVALSRARNWVRSKARPVERQPDRAPAERRVFLSAGALEIGQHLVAPDIDGAECDALAVGGVEHLAIKLLLRLRAREG